ncbi:hypothetical protein [Roseospirillum parvum]|uniref:Uncharacterized protein n=1 Tax=Roseospirillum parvum TaxID=83401 RepID=A0A1G7X1S8_9PROT|nr:hypothetical protein [Roseospirillum parvum]SDG78129.1 hypothetical protein SAMN05421742_102401 [Roseospirillum parvum]
MLRPVPFLLAALLLCAAPLSSPAWADEIEDSLQAALDAYRDGDLALAKEELDYAGQMLSEKKAAGLADFLPEPLSGWERQDGDTQAMTAGMMGGGMSASASYSNGDTRLEISLVADSPMVGALAAVFNNAAMMGQMGKLRRIDRQKVIETEEGELQAVIDNRILVSINGPAPVEDKEAYFKALDIDGLEDF